MRLVESNEPGEYTVFGDVAWVNTVHEFCVTLIERIKDGQQNKALYKTKSRFWFDLVDIWFVGGFSLNFHFRVINRCPNFSHESKIWPKFCLQRSIFEQISPMTLQFRPTFGSGGPFLFGFIGTGFGFGGIL